MLTLEELRTLVSYDPETGEFLWLVDVHRVKAGSIAGHVSKSGYRLIKIQQIKWRAHRLAFWIMTGKLPENEIDHKNRIRSDNRWINLRHVTHKQNQENRASPPMRGIRWEADREKYLVRIKHFGVTKNLGRFELLEDAIAARRSAERATFTHSQACEQSS